MRVVTEREGTPEKPLSNDSFVRACRGETTAVTPVWFMRQAGRCLPEYRSLRERHSILEVCQTPELAAEVTLQPVRRLGVDAAILFSDIVVPLLAMGVDLDIKEGVGPVVFDPIRTLEDVKGIHDLPPAGVNHVNETVTELVRELEIPLIGFAGAPFTLASYLIEGGPSKNHARTKRMMYADPDTWTELMSLLARAVTTFLRGQVDAGARAIQLFDSWVGTLSPDDFRTYVKPYVVNIFEGLQSTNVPRVIFGVTTGELLAELASTGCDVVGVDWRVPLDDARGRVGAMPVQGNLDPTVCLAPSEVIRSKAIEVLDRGGGRGHVFNLGHGVLPETDPDALARLVDVVHEWTPNG
jgi:uroporphyrinogen decarboxylase